AWRRREARSSSMRRSWRRICRPSRAAAMSPSRMPASVRKLCRLGATFLPQILNEVILAVAVDVVRACLVGGDDLPVRRRVHGGVLDDGLLAARTVHFPGPALRSARPELGGSLLGVAESRDVPVLVVLRRQAELR